ncbi:MAG: hypothetical protein ACRD5M_10520 [Candidatus Acidiferrales bacterium]
MFMVKLDKMKSSLALVLSLLTFTQARAQSSGNTTQPPPAGWYVYSAKEVDSESLHCLNYTMTSWRVSAEDNDVRITEYRPQAVQQSPLPSGFQLRPEWSRGRRHSLKFEGGWLIGIDAGEWGGGLWITNEDGSASRIIVEDDVSGIVPTAQGIFVLSGLAHSGFDFGNVLMLSHPHDMQVTLEWTASLVSAPQAYVKLADDSVLVIDRFGAWQITSSGGLKRLFYLKPVRGFYPLANSIVKTANGTIYVGMRTFVLRFLPGGVGQTGTKSEYTEDFLLPDTCRKFKMDWNRNRMQCTCTP